jgi:phosphoribosylanthranilate isomerase
MTAIKICGLTRVQDAERALDLGVEALGINLWEGSRRWCDPFVAGRIVEAARGRARVVAVTVDASDAQLGRIRGEVGIEWLQFHGDEPPERVRAFLPKAFRAVRAEGREGLRAAFSAPGLEVLVDACVPGHRGGTGVLADWALAAQVARARPLWLAGGLTPDNVAEAVRAVRPMGVDVAGGVESAPGVKDPERLAAFVRAVRAGALR